MIDEFQKKIGSAALSASCLLIIWASWRGYGIVNHKYCFCEDISVELIPLTPGNQLDFERFHHLDYPTDKATIEPQEFLETRRLHIIFQVHSPRKVEQ